MSDWDLMMPGMGLTAIGVAGVTISYAGIAHTFIDGMHALTGLTLFFGLIILAAGILNGGVSTSNRAKATTLVVLSIIFSFGMYGFIGNTITTLGTFSGIMMIITVPAVVIAYIAMKMPRYLKPVGSIFALASATGIIAFAVFGTMGPSPYLLAEEVVEEAEVPPEPVESAAVALEISILEGSSVPDSPDYDPDAATVSQGDLVRWVNADAQLHTATSSADQGETFASGLLNAGEEYILDTSDIVPGEYEYFCELHLWMVGTLTVLEAADTGDSADEEMIEAGSEMPAESAMPEESSDSVTIPADDAKVQDAAGPALRVSIPNGASIPADGQIYYDPESVTVSVPATILWSNDDEIGIHTITALDGSFDSEFVASGETYSREFTDAGTFDYYCTLHPWMTGTVIAQ